MNTIKLKEEFNKYGFKYVLVTRTEEKCMYAQYMGDRITSYEVFRTKLVNNHNNIKSFDRLNKSVTDLSNIEEFKEVFPSNEEFGKRAWAAPNLVHAHLIYDGL